jgi:hypothetical protein
VIDTPNSRREPRGETIGLVSFRDVVVPVVLTQNRFYDPQITQPRTPKATGGTVSGVKLRRFRIWVDLSWRPKMPHPNHAARFLTFVPASLAGKWRCVRRGNSPLLPGGWIVHETKICVILPRRRWGSGLRNLWNFYLYRGDLLKASTPRTSKPAFPTRAIAGIRLNTTA